MKINKYKFNEILICIFIYLIIDFTYNNSAKKVGVIGLSHSQNVGNNLLKYAMFIKLSELGYFPYIIGNRFQTHNISFISNVVRLKLIKNYSEINENDYDILMVNSDQTWRKWADDFYDIAFLKFAEKWKKPKFIYGTSTGKDEWIFSKEDEETAKFLLKNFTGISVREKNLIELIELHLGFKSVLVLDPTLLINKKHYLNLIKDFKSELINQTNNDEYIFAYILKKRKRIDKYLKFIKNHLKIKIYYLTIFNPNQVKEFLFGIINSKAVITDSFHGTVFSIIFKKPFISYAEDNDPRFNSLFSILNIQNRKFKKDSFPPISLLNQDVIINERRLKSLKIESIRFLKKNLNYRP